MARDFDGTADAYSLGSALFTSSGFSMCCWFNPDDLTADHTLLAVSASGSFNGWFLTLSGTTGGDPIAASSLAGTQNSAFSTSGLTVGTWHHCCAIFTSDTSRTIFLDGGNSATDTAANSPGGTINQTEIGRTGLGAAQNFTNGQIAEVAFWNVALSTSEVVSLSSGVSPLRVRCANLVSYVPLLGISSTEPDYINSSNWTAVSAPPQADHAPVAPMFSFDMGWKGNFTAVAPAATHPGYYQSRGGWF